MNGRATERGRRDTVASPSPFDRSLWRAALAIRQRLSAIRRDPGTLAFPEASAAEIATLIRRVHRAAQRGWHGAARRLAERLRTVTYHHRLRVDEFDRELRSGERALPKLAELYADLVALCDEFSGVRFDEARRNLVVRTFPISLEEIDFGGFDVVLSINRLGSASPYGVIAVTPNPAATHPSVVHPHVDNDALCEGEGRDAIARALRDGRPFDFFVLVDRILRTYNSDSPFVALDEWDGVACSDCGRVVADDERTTCCRCDADLCDDCSPCCDGCGLPVCGSCSTPCSTCDAPLCSSCQHGCRDCGETFCAEHLDHDQRCPHCGDAAKETRPPPAPTVHARRLGEASFSP